MNDKPQPLQMHLNEIRRRLLVCFFFLAVFSTLCLIYMDQLLDLLKRPAGEELQQLAVFSPTAAVVSYLSIAVAGGLIFSIPVFLYQAWMFILPALRAQSQKKGLVFIASGTFLFLAGACMSYFVLLPVSLQFLLNIGKNDLVFLISLDAYISFVLLLILGGGIIFEMPILTFALTKLGILTAEQMLKGWKVAIILILVASAFLTPTPDAVNMTLMTVPMFALYLLSISVSKFAERNH
jgi:sec-independent protein translocase protein TatC